MKRIFGLLFAVLLVLPSLGLAQDELTTYTVIIKEHQFTPQTLTVKAGEKFKLIVDNQDDTAEEFESHDLKREKLIKAHKQGTILLGPLAKGTYNFVGEFHEKTAKGSIVVE